MCGFSSYPCQDNEDDVYQDKLCSRTRYCTWGCIACCIFSNKFAQSNPKTVAAFVKGIFKGLDFLKTNPKEGLAIVAKQLKITPEELEQQLKGIQIPGLKTNMKMMSDSNSALYMLKPMTKLAEFLKAQGQIQSVPDLSKLLDPQFVKTTIT